MPSTKSKPPRHVAVFIEPSRAVGSNMLKGIGRYNREHGNWIIHYEPRSLESPLPRWLRDWHGDGILARVTTRQQAAAFQATGLPVIDLRGARSEMPFSAVEGDNRSVAQLAFTHLRERGLVHFAYCGLSADQHCYQGRRVEEFRREVEKTGFSCSIHYFRNKPEDWEQYQRQLVDWLRAQPKPLGILACYDDYGYQVLNACRRSGLAVPEEVAVLSVDDDPALCNMAVPSMSSIRFDTEGVGYLAASLLDRLMDGQIPPSQPILYQPCGVAARRSTDTFAFDDPALNRVLRFIHEHACKGIRVSDLPSVAHLSLSKLERCFHRYLERTPKEELLRVQIDQAKQLLRDTKLSLKVIAHRAGFSSDQYFSYVFHRECGIRPSDYRADSLIHGRGELI